MYVLYIIYSCIQVADLVFTLFLVKANCEIPNIMQFRKWAFPIKRMEITAFQSNLYSFLTGSKILATMCVVLQNENHCTCEDLFVNE
jgi:hypothetical protein